MSTDVPTVNARSRPRTGSRSPDAPAGNLPLSRGPWLVPVPLIVAAATMVIVATTVHLGTTHAGATDGGFVADAAAGWTLTAAGAFSLLQRSMTRIGTRALLAGMVWFAADWAGWGAGPSIVRSIAELVSAFYLAIVIDVAVSARRPEPPWSTGAIRVAYGATAMVAVATAAVRDPRFDPGCWQLCSNAGFALLPDSAVAGALAGAWLVMVMIGGGFLAANAWRHVRRPRRSAMDAISLACGAVGVVSVLHAIALWGWGPENPFDPPFALLFQASAWSAAALGLAIIVEVARVRRARSALTALASSLVEVDEPGNLEQALVVATGDPSLRVAYPRRGSQALVDADGMPIDEPLAGSGRAVLAIARDGRPVALVDHDPSAIDAAALPDEIGAGGRLAVENERLRAELRAHARELRASRRQTVAVADAARQQLERDIHDGAQQRLIALGYDVALAAAAVRDLAPATAAALADVRHEIREALEELRQLAHGIFPAVLDQAGVAAALQTLAERSPIPVELESVPEGRYGTMVESTAYVLVVEVISTAAAHGATYARVHVRAEDAAFDLVLEHDAGAAQLDTVALSDRVGAAGGQLSVETTGSQVEVRARIPFEP